MFIYFFLIYKKISDKHVCTVVLNLPEVICKELYSFIQEESKGRLSTICKCMKCSNQVCRGIKQIASKFSHYNLNQLSMSIENIIITPREDIFSLSATKNQIFMLDFRYILMQANYSIQFCKFFQIVIWSRYSNAVSGWPFWLIYQAL